MALLKRSLKIAGHATSVSLEPEFWEALEKIALARGLSVPALLREIDQKRGDSSLASAIRVFILKETQKELL